MSRKVSFSPDVDDDYKATAHHKHVGSGAKVGENKKRIVYIWSLNLSENSGFSPARVLKCIGAKVARAVRFMSNKKRSSRRVSSASLARSKSYAETLDSHRAEAIEDCIEFLNSSSCLQRSNSVRSSC